MSTKKRNPQEAKFTKKQNPQRSEIQKEAGKIGFYYCFQFDKQLNEYHVDVILNIGIRFKIIKM